MVDVAAIGCEDGFAADEAAGDGEGGIEERDGEGHEGGRHAEEGRRLLAPEDAVAAEQETDEEAAAIAEEDGRGVEIVAEEAQEGADEGRGGEGEPHVAGEQRGHEGGDGREEADAGCESIHAVDEVDGVHAADEPEDGDERVPDLGADDVAADGIDLHSGRTGEGSRQDLAGEFLPGLESEEVVEQAGEEDGEDGGEEPDG